MADIRLKRITVENSPLTIGNGDIYITSTSASNDLLNASIRTNGGISINNTYEATSSTSGGCMTVGGGVGIMKSTFIGQNLTLDSLTGILSANGLSEKRFFVDSVWNKKIYMSPDGINRTFELTDTSLKLNSTTGSSNSTTGALCVQGGVSINCTNTSSDSSNGGALTVAGGAAIAKDMDIGETLAVGKEYSDTPGITIRYTGTNQISLLNSSGSSWSALNMNNNDLVFYNNEKFIFKNNNNDSLIIDNSLIESKKVVVFSNTKTSIDASTGSVVVNGGITIRCTQDAISSTNGGSFTTLGGVAISKKTHTGDSVGINVKNEDKKNKLVLYQSAGNLNITDAFSGIGNSVGSILYNISSTVDDHVFTKSGNENSSLFRIKGTGEIVLNGMYSFLPGGHTSDAISFKNNTTGISSYLDLFTQDGDASVNNLLRIYGKGLQTNTANSQFMELGWNVAKDAYIINVNKSGIESSKKLIVSSVSTFFDVATLSSNSSTGAIVLNGGGLSINCSINSVNVSSGGAVTVAGGVSISKDTRIGGSLSLGASSIYTLTSTSSGILNVSSISPFVEISGTSGSVYDARLSIYSLSSGDNKEHLDISTNTTSGYSIVSSFSGSGNARFISVESSSNVDQLVLQTSGNVGIGGVHDPQYKLDVDGTIHATGDVTISSSANLVVGGGVSINSTMDALSLTEGGSLTLGGGASIGRNMFVGGSVYIQDTTYSSSTSAALMVNGGVTIFDSTNSFAREGGALTVLGGASITGDLWVLGAINGGADSDSTYYHLTILATDNSTNMSSGSLISLGGVTIQTSKNAVNVSNGGALLVAGGTSIGGDLYIGGDNYFYGITNFRGNLDNTNIFNFTDRFNIKRFSIDRSVATSDLSICRYDTSGDLIEQVFTIENANGKFTFRNTTNSTSSYSGSVIFRGGLAISCSSNSSNYSNGGALTIDGGASVRKDLHIGGKVVFHSTDDSLDVNTGALVVKGGVGIGGSLNVNGNISVIGDLSVLGSTTSVNSSNLSINDNKLVLNSGPSGLCDSGILISRYQTDNNADSGNVISDPFPLIFELPGQIGLTSTQIKLPTNASSQNNFYVGWWSRITSGFSSNQVRKIIAYDGSTKIATISSAWTTQNPSVGDYVYLYNKPCVGMMFNEQTNRFEFGATVQNATEGCITLTTPLPVYFASASISSTDVSSNSSTGSVVVNGGISIANTTDSSSLTQGGALTIAGGASITKTLHVGSLNINGVSLTPKTGDFTSLSYTDTVNNRTLFSDVEGFFFDINSVWSVDIYIAVRIIATRKLYANFHIRAISKETSWEIIKTYVGDDTGIDFYMTNSGQLQYKSQNYPGFVSCTFKGRSLSN